MEGIGEVKAEIDTGVEGRGRKMGERAFEETV
jgi:hypothetical protein